MLAVRVARRFWFKSEDDRREAEADALCWAIEQIGEFTYAPKKNAFAFFTSVVYNRIAYHVSTNAKRRTRVKLFTDVVDAERSERREHAVAGGAALNPLDTARPYAWAV